MAYKDDTLEKINEMVNSGFEVTYTEPRKILLDLDTPQAKKQFDLMLPMVSDYIPGGIIIIDRYTSKSGNGEHVVLETQQALSLNDRLLFQCILGSDVKRELLSWANIQRADRLIDQYISILFKPPSIFNDDEPDYF